MYVEGKMFKQFYNEKLYRYFGPKLIATKTAMDAAMDYENKHGRTPEDVSFFPSFGCGIRSQDEEAEHRYIKVKAIAKEGAITLTLDELLTAQRLKEEFWLYVVDVKSNPELLYLIQNPIDKFKGEFEKVLGFMYTIKSWKEKAEAAG